MDENQELSTTGGTNEEEEEEALTAAEVLKKLEEAWLNEKFSPELLEHQTDVVECMLEQIQEMENNLSQLDKADFRITVHRMEIDRIRYVVCSYLRCRLEKIQNYTSYILEQEKQRGINSNSRLSPEELQFAKDYAAGNEDHLKLLALRHLPLNLQSMDAITTLPKPNFNSYVFLKVNEATPSVLIEDETNEAGEEIIDLEKGSQHIMKYQSIAHLVKTGAVSLI